MKEPIRSQGMSVVHFWKGYSSQESQESQSPFQSLLRDSELSIKPRVYPIRSVLPSELPLLQSFIETHFKTHSSLVLKPVLDIRSDILLISTDETGIVGCIRYKKGGDFHNNPIHVIDCFCVHPAYRRKGLASDLLIAIHEYVMSNGLNPYNLFLKEGRPIQELRPLYSSFYAYRRIRDLKGFKPPVGISLSPHKAARLLAIYREIHPDTFCIHSPENLNQHWIFWKKGLSWMLVCFQDAYQEFEGKSVGILSAFLQSGRKEPEIFEQLIDRAPFDWIWTDRVFVSCSDLWTTDGPFHWYAYQWTTNLRPFSYYCMVT